MALRINRRQFGAAGLAAAAFAGLAYRSGAQEAADDYRNEVPGYGPLVPDPDGLFDLPSGFRYRIISRAGEIDIGPVLEEQGHHLKLAGTEHRRVEAYRFSRMGVQCGLEGSLSNITDKGDLPVHLRPRLQCQPGRTGVEMFQGKVPDVG